MSTEHRLLIVSTPQGCLTSCTCGWRAGGFHNFSIAQELADKHEDEEQNN